MFCMKILPCHASPGILSTGSQSGTAIDLFIKDGAAKSSQGDLRERPGGQAPSLVSRSQQYNVEREHCSEAGSKRAAGSTAPIGVMRRSISK